MARKRKSLVRLRGGIYCENFTVKGHRFRGSLGTDDEETAEILAAERKKNALLGNLITKKPEMTLTQANGRMWLEHGQYLLRKEQIKYRAGCLEQGLGKHILLSEITPAMMISYISKRRIGRSPITVNGDLLYLNQLLRRGRDLWDVAIPKFRVRELLLPEPDHRQHILTPTEEERVFSLLRDDMQGMVCFAMATGLRLSNVIFLKWDQIKWELGHIEFRVKSKKEGGKIHIVPLTDFLVHLLDTEKGNDPEYVFTMIAEKDHTKSMTGERFVKGTRYPYTRSEAWRKPWQQALTRAGLWEKGSKGTNFRFHDLRHTAATRLYKATRNLKLVQRFLGHATIQMTMRYLGIDVDDLRHGMDLIVPTHFGHTPTSEIEKNVPTQ